MLPRRRLPHVYPENTWLFLTWRLHGSIPANLAVPTGKLLSGQMFVWLDRHLDCARYGPAFLREARIAQIVRDSLNKGAELGHYILDAYVIMPNHVHMLALPRISPSLFLKSLKGATAREANRHLQRVGEPFWQKESYDHWVRSPEEHLRIRAYIENNPVKAGLSQGVEDYPWSSASVETSLDTARTSACAT